jgi:hypothetical protein
VIAVDHRCLSCGATARAEPAQDVVGDRLAWSVSIRCPGCGDAQEIDGWDDTPADVRAAILAEGGLTRVSVDPAADRLAVLTVLRDGRSLSEAADTYTRLTAGGLTGTAAEMRLLADRLTAAGARVNLQSAR